MLEVIPPLLKVNASAFLTAASESAPRDRIEKLHWGQIEVLPKGGRRFMGLPFSAKGFPYRHVARSEPFAVVKVYRIDCDGAQLLQLNKGIGPRVLHLTWHCCN